MIVLTYNLKGKYMVGRIAYVCFKDVGNLIIGSLIEDGYVVDIIKDKNDIKVLIKPDEIKVLVVHASSEKADELELANQMKINYGFDKVKVIVVTSFTLREIIMKALHIGADDILTNVNDTKQIVKRIEDISGIRKANKSDDLFVEKDFILLSFEELVNREVKAAGRGAYCLSIVCLYPITIDGSPMDCTEEFMNSLKTIIRNSLRDTDYAFLHEKFVVAVLPFADEDGCQIVIDRLKDVYQSHSVLKPENSYSTLEANYATFPKDGRVVEKLLNKIEMDINTVSLTPHI